jgi:protein phosphatase
MKPGLMQSFGVTDRGTVRPINEDRYVADEDLGLLVVADGMGGHQAGEVASQAAVEAIVTFIRRTADDGECTWPFGIDPTLTFNGNRLRTAIAIANRRVFRLSESQDEFTGMGTTIASALFAEGRAVVGHAGDSRVYHWSGGRLVRLTADDTWAASLLATHTADAESIKHHPMRNVLTNVVGVREDATIHLQEYALEPGDVLLLSSDGLHGSIDDEAIAAVLQRHPLPDVPAVLVKLALDNGSRDNVTALVGRYTGGA